jgi:hypothetical protein
MACLWFGTFFIFQYIGTFIFLGVETTNQMVLKFLVYTSGTVETRIWTWGSTQIRNGLRHVRSAVALCWLG